MAITEKFVLAGANTTLLSSGLNSLANNSLAAGTAFDNTQGQTGDGYTLGDLQLSVTFGTSPTAGTGVSVWLLQTLDGSTYEDGSSTVTPGRAPDVVFPVRAVTTAQVMIRRCVLPPGKWTPLLKNDGTGQAFASSGNTLILRPVTPQGV